MSEEIEKSESTVKEPVVITLQITEFDYKALKLIRNYFGEKDITGLEHLAFAVLDRVIKVPMLGIDFSQIEAYNQGVEDAAKKAITKTVESGSNAFYIEVDKESILKLKKSVLKSV